MAHMVFRLTMSAPYLREGDKVVDTGVYVARAEPGSWLLFSDGTLLTSGSQAWNVFSEEIEFVL